MRHEEAVFSSVVSFGTVTAMRHEEAVSLKVGTKEVGGTNPTWRISFLKKAIHHSSYFLPSVSKLIFTLLFL